MMFAHYVSPLLFCLSSSLLVYFLSLIISPGVFLSFRDDKKVNTEDVGISQITKIISLEPVKKSNTELKESEILHREVYVIY